VVGEVLPCATSASMIPAASLLASSTISRISLRSVGGLLCQHVPEPEKRTPWRPSFGCPRNCATIMME
jgi:hypothetical protein